MSDAPYVIVCAGCNALAEVLRRDVLTCSAACRVRAHRNGSTKVLRDVATRMEIAPASILQAKAVDALLPELTPRILSGSMSIGAAQVPVRRAFVELLFSGALERVEGTRRIEVQA